MRTSVVFFVAFSVFTFVPTGYGNPLTEPKATKDKIEKIQNDLIEIRRDQLNYKIEKDLLKETYSSNLQTINIVITIILGVFTVLGFFGIRSIGVLRKEYSDELKDLIKTREQLTSQMALITREQEEARKKYTEFASINEEQDKRLKVLEIQEKVGNLIKNRNFVRALEYISVGLSTSPNDILLLRMKLRALSGINQFSQAIEVGEKLLELEPEDASTVMNLCEAYLLVERLGDYDTLKTKYGEQIRKRADGAALFSFFEALRGVIAEDLAAVKNIIVEYLSNASPGQSQRIPAWDFSEVRTYLKNKQQTQATALFMEFMMVLQGQKDPKDIQPA